MLDNIFDIRSSLLARKTLVNLTGVDFATWEKYEEHKREYAYIGDLVKDVIKTHGHFPCKYNDLEFVYFHVTTSANGCSAIKKHGILDLKSAYLCKESELRLFLDHHGVLIDLDRCLLSHMGKNYDISYSAGMCPKSETSEYLCWLIGRKFYYDYTTCGFLSVCEQNPYGGQVHRRPEILLDIDNLLKTHFSHEWEQSHLPYEIAAHVSGDNIIFDGDDQSDQDKLLMYLTMAYDTAFEKPSEHIILMKNDIQIPADSIIEIKTLSHWK